MINIFITLLTFVLTQPNQDQNQTLKPSPNKYKISQAYEAVSNYHSEATKSNNSVKLVYFHGNDCEPQSNLIARLTRVLDDVSSFYGEQFQRHGIDIKGIPFDKVNGKYNIQMVKGDSSSKSYTIKSGPAILTEIQKKTAGNINMLKDYVLIINNLWYKRIDGTYVFHSPYGGTGSSTNGFCLVADCDLLDPMFLRDSNTRMRFSEMAVVLKECPVSEFNSWYIGGIAHELAHVFGLPHDFGNKIELDPSTISLMGQYGSRHFRDYLWDGEKSAVFSSASIIQLISHPVFTQSNKDIYFRPPFSVTDIAFSIKDLEITLNGKINTKRVPYAVVALVRPVLLSEYFNQSSSDIITNNDSFSINLGQLSAGDFNLQLVFIFPNGTTSKLNRIISVDSEHKVKLKS